MAKNEALKFVLGCLSVTTMASMFVCCLGALLMNSASNVKTVNTPRPFTSPKSSAKAKEQERSPVRVGDDVIVKYPRSSAGDIVFLTVTYEDQDEWYKIIQARDTVGQMQFIAGGNGFAVPSGTRARLLERGIICHRVRIMDGTQLGKAGWLPTEFVTK